MTEKIFRIIVADDHSVVTEGIRVILKSDIRFKICGIFANADSVLKFLEQEEIDIIVLDIDMPGANKFSLLKAIKENHPLVKVVIFTMHEGMNYFFDARKNGADSYALKSESITFLPSILMQTLKGIFYCSDAVKVHLSKDAKKKSLTPIENEIFDFLAQGFRYNEIAEKINKSEKTIEYYIYKLRKKYNVQSNAELILQLKEMYSK